MFKAGNFRAELSMSFLIIVSLLCLSNSRSEGKKTVSFSALILPSLPSISVQGSLKKDRLISLESKSEWGAELGQGQMSAGHGL